MAAPNNTAPNSSLIASIANNFILKLVLVLSVLGSLLLLVYVKGETAGGKVSKPEVTVHLTPHGKQLLKLQEPKRLQSQYRGDPQLIAALTSGATRPLALATADFNRDAAPDLVSGYGFGQRGVITVQRGNVDAFVPQKQEIFNNAAKGILPPSFVSSADVLDLPDAPDFIAIRRFQR